MFLFFAIVMFIPWLLGCSETYYLGTRLLDLVVAQVKKLLNLAWYNPPDNPASTCMRWRRQEIVKKDAQPPG